jgi:hypothetical protein
MFNFVGCCKVTLPFSNIELGKFLVLCLGKYGMCYNLAGVRPTVMILMHMHSLSH